MGKYLVNRNFEKNLIAPCGMNCGTCIAFLRTAKPCLGCMVMGDSKPKHCITCSIKNCEFLIGSKSRFCFFCPKFPCSRVKNLDKRYRQKYNTSLIENLENIKSIGLSAFVENEQIRWKCPSCGSVLCVHRDCCLQCNTAIFTEI